jgi:hypothetical protein
METTHTLFEYMYRDAGNNKAYGAALLLGTLSPQETAKFKSLLNEEVWFIAEQVGLPSLMPELWKFGGGPNEEDFPFHEFFAFTALDQALVSQLELWGSCASFIERFEEVQNKWDISKSMCCGY